MSKIVIAPARADRVRITHARLLLTSPLVAHAPDMTTSWARPQPLQSPWRRGAALRRICRAVRAATSREAGASNTSTFVRNGKRLYQGQARTRVTTTEKTRARAQRRLVIRRVSPHLSPLRTAQAGRVRVRTAGRVRVRMAGRDARAGQGAMRGQVSRRDAGAGLRCQAMAGRDARAGQGAMQGQVSGRDAGAGLRCQATCALVRQATCAGHVRWQGAPRACAGHVRWQGAPRAATYTC